MFSKFIIIFEISVAFILSIILEKENLNFIKLNYEIYNKFLTELFFNFFFILSIMYLLKSIYFFLYNKKKKNYLFISIIICIVAMYSAYNLTIFKIIFFAVFFPLILYLLTLKEIDN